MATSNEKPAKATGTAASRGKVKGKGTVTPPKASQEAEGHQEPAGASTTPDPGPGPSELGGESEAFELGRLASVHGRKGKPPEGMSEAMKRQWYAGYKSHANPNAESTVEGIQSGYRKDY